MQFTYHSDAGTQSLKIDGDLHKYLFKIRRQDSTENLFFRNLKDNNIYEYEAINISRRDTLLNLVNTSKKIIEPAKNLHIGWCIIDTKEVEKNIALLNEIGVSKITFITCQYSQKKYKINFEKIEKLLQNSSSQCGRSNIISLDTCNSLEEFIKQYPDTYMFNFSSNNINNYKEDIKTIVIGCEGGFSQDEISLINQDKIVGCNINAILKSQTAVVSVSSIVLS
jgi:16S rRNA (uracil1498-N3)-methyltransferase